MNILDALRAEIESLITQTLHLQPEQAARIEVSIKAEQRAQFGDLSCNAALVCAHLLKKQPRTIAEQLNAALSAADAAHAPLLAAHLERIEIAGPGFINLFFAPSLWIATASELLSDQQGFFAHDPATTKRYLLEFVSANPTGPLHLGHGRGGIIGDVLARVLRFLGHEADTEFYINDAGSQIKKLGESLKARCLQELGKIADMPEDGYHGEYLADVARDFIAQKGDEIASFDDGEFAYFARRHLLQLIEKTLAMYGITFNTWFSESTLYPGAVDEVLKILTDKGVLYENEGALWFRATDFGDDQDRVLRKTDGTYTYITADIAYHKNKFDRAYDVVVNVLGQDHHGYVNRLKGTMTALGYPAENLHVILYQLVKVFAG